MVHKHLCLNMVVSVSVPFSVKFGREISVMGKSLITDFDRPVFSYVDGM